MESETCQQAQNEPFLDTDPTGSNMNEPTSSQKPLGTIPQLLIRRHCIPSTATSCLASNSDTAKRYSNTFWNRCNIHSVRYTIPNFIWQCNPSAINLMVGPRIRVWLHQLFTKCIKFIYTERELSMEKDRRWHLWNTVSSWKRNFWSRVHVL